jgi:glutaredoxin
MPPLAAILGLMLLALPAAAEMYRVVRDDGKVVYTDTPPGEASTKSVKKLNVESWMGSPQIGNARTASPSSAGSSPAASSRSGLTVYTTATCGYCKAAKRYMAAKGIAYSEVDIERDASGHAEYKRLGGRGVPFFVAAGGRTMSGFGEEALEQLLRGGR